MKRFARGYIGQQKGFALLTVLILMLVGSLIITPLLNFMGTGVKTTMVYNTKSQELYAADAGIEDGRWLIEKDKVATTFPGPNPPKYDPFDYFESTGDGWSYDLASQTGRTVNGYSVNVTLRNMWIPDLPVPDAANAKAIIQGSVGNPPKLVMTGAVVDLPGATTPGTYKIKITLFRWRPSHDQYARDMAASWLYLPCPGKQQPCKPAWDRPTENVHDRIMATGRVQEWSGPGLDLQRLPVLR